MAHCVSPRLGAGAAAKATRHFIVGSDSLLVCVHQFLSVMTITAPLPECEHRERLRAVSSAHRIAAAIPYCRYEPFARFPRSAVPGTLPPNVAASDLVGHRYGRLQRRPGGV